MESGSRTVLLAGSGPGSHVEWEAQGYKAFRLDIEPRTNPDILGSMTALGDIGPYDVVYCSHALEHLYPHEVVVALKEFYRVLKPGGAAIILVPDLEDVKPNDDVLDLGCTGLHLYYGDASQIEEFPFMAHHCGFVKETLKTALELAGFKATTERKSMHNLLGVGVKH